MNSDIKVSLIIPVYNGAEFIRRSFDSCIYQTLNEIEIIAVNDCSPDNRDAEIMREYEKTYPDKFRCIFHEKNKRQGGARNTGIRAARGRYFLCVDQDDFIGFEMCEEMYEKAINEDSDIVMCGYNFCSRGTITYHEPVICREENFEKFAPAVWRLLTRKQFVIDNRVFFPEKVVTDDVVSILWFMLTDKYSITSKPYYYWMRHMNAESAIVTYRYCDSVPLSFIEISHYDAYQKLPDDKKQKFAIMAAHHLYVSVINCVEYHSNKITELCSLVKTALNMLDLDFTRKVFRNTLHGKIVAAILNFVVEHLDEEDFLAAIHDFLESLIVRKIKEQLLPADPSPDVGNAPIVIWGAGIRGKRLAGFFTNGDIPFEITDSKTILWGKKIFGRRIRPWDELKNFAHTVVFSPIRGFDEVKTVVNTNCINLLNFQDLIGDFEIYFLYINLPKPLESKKAVICAK